MFFRKYIGIFGCNQRDYGIRDLKARRSERNGSEELSKIIVEGYKDTRDKDTNKLQ